MSARALWLFSLVVILGAPVAAVTPANGQQKAYGYALRCYAAGVAAATDKTVNPDGSKTETFKAGSRRSFEAAQAMGKALGYARQRVLNDLDSSGLVEVNLMVRDSAYFEKSVSDCTKLGLM